MKISPRLLRPLGLSLVAGVGFVAGAMAQTATTDPVGFITLTVAGGGSTSAPSLSFLGLGMTQTVAFAGNLESASGNTVVDNDSTWTDNQYNGASNNYYIELTSGTGVGLTAQITGTTASTHSLTLDTNLSSFVTNGTTYKIRPNWTLATVFGGTNSAGLTGGSSTTADQVLVYNSSTGKYTSYYYKTTSFPPGSGTGWRSGTDNTTDVSTTTYFKPSDGVLVQHVSSAAVTFPLVGAVKLGTSDLPVNTGLNIEGNPYPSGNFTLATSGLYTGSATTGVGGGTSTTADQVLLYNSSTGKYTSYYYKTTSFPPGSGTGWRAGTDTTTDVSSTALPFGQSILIQRQAANGVFEWVAPQPF